MATSQYPLGPEIQKHPPIILFNLQEIRICVDPLLCKWLLYTPKQSYIRISSTGKTSLLNFIADQISFY